MFTPDSTGCFSQATDKPTIAQTCPHWDALCPFRIAVAQATTSNALNEISLFPYLVKVLESKTAHTIRHYTSYPFKNVDPAIQLAILFSILLAFYVWLYVRFVAPKDRPKIWTPDQGIKFGNDDRQSRHSLGHGPSGLFSGNGEPVELDSVEVPNGLVEGTKRGTKNRKATAAKGKANTKAHRAAKATEGQSASTSVRRQRSLRRLTRAGARRRSDG